MASFPTDKTDFSKHSPVEDSVNQLNNFNKLFNQNRNCNVPLTGGASVMQSASLQMKPISENKGNGCWSSSAQNKGLEDDYLYHSDSMENCAEKSPQDICNQSQTTKSHSLHLHNSTPDDASSSYYRRGTPLTDNDRTIHIDDPASTPSYSHLSLCSSTVYHSYCPVSTNVDHSLDGEKSPVFFPLSPSFTCNNISEKSVSTRKSLSTNSHPVNDTCPMMSPGHHQLSNSAFNDSAEHTPSNSPEHTPLNSPSYSFLNLIPRHGNDSPTFTPMLPSRHDQVWLPNTDIPEEVSISNTNVQCSVRESYIPLSNSQPIYKNTGTNYALGSSTSEEFRNAHEPLGAVYSSQYLSLESLSVGNSFDLNQKRSLFEQSDLIYQSQELASTAGFAEAGGSDDSLDIIELARDVKVPEVITLADDSANEADCDGAGLLKKDLSQQRKKTGNHGLNREKNNANEANGYVAKLLKDLSQQRKKMGHHRLSDERNISWKKTAHHSSTVASHRKHIRQSEYQSKKKDSATNFRQSGRQRVLSGSRSTRKKKMSSRHSRVKESNLILERLEAKPLPGSIGELLLHNHTKRFVEKVIVSTKSIASRGCSNQVPASEKPSGDSTGANTEEEEELLLLRKEALQSVVLVLDQRNSQQATALPVETSLASGSSESSLSFCNKAANTECSDLDTSPNKSLIQECQDPVDMEISVSDLDESNKGIENSELREVGDNINIPIEWAYMIPPPSADQKNDIHNFEHFSIGQNLCKQAMESTCLENCSQSAVLGSEYPVNLTNNLMDNYLMQSSDEAKFNNSTSAFFLADASPYHHHHKAPSYDPLPLPESNNLPPPRIENLPPSGIENLLHTGSDIIPPTGPNNFPPCGSNKLSLPNFLYDYGHSFTPSRTLLPQCDVTQTLSETNAFNQEAFMDAVTKKKSNEGNLIHIKINKTAQKQHVLNQSRPRKGRKQRKKPMKRLFISKQALSLVRDNCVPNVGNTSCQFLISSAAGNAESENNNLTRLDVPEASSQDDDDEDADETFLRNQLLKSLQSKNVDPNAGLTYNQISHRSTDLQKPLGATLRSSTDYITMLPNIAQHRLGYILMDGSIKDSSTSKNAAVDVSAGKLPVLTFRYPKPIIINLNNDSDSDSTQDSGPGPISSNEDSSTLQNTIDSFLKGIREVVNSGSGNATSSTNAVCSSSLKLPEFTATPKVMQHLSRPAQMEYRRMKLRMQEIHQAKKLKLAQMHSRLETLTEQSTASDCSTDCGNADFVGDVSSELTDEHMKKTPTLRDNAPGGHESDSSDLRQTLLKTRYKWNTSITKTDNLDDESSQNSGEDLRNFLQRNAHQAVSLAEPQIRDSSDHENNSSAEPSDVPSSFSEKVQCYLREARKKSESCDHESTDHPLKEPSLGSSCSSSSDTDSDSSLSSTSSNDDRSQDDKLCPYRDTASDPTITNPFNGTMLVETPSCASKCVSRLANQLSPAPSDGLSSEVSSNTDSDSDSSHSRDKTIQESIHGDNFASAPIREPCVKLVESEVANTSSNEAILGSMESQKTPFCKISSLVAAKESVVLDSALEDASYETAVSSELLKTPGTPLDNLLNTLESLIHSGDVAANATDCCSEKFYMQSRRAGDVGIGTGSLHECSIPIDKLIDESEKLSKDESDDQSSPKVHTSGETSKSCNSDLVDSSTENALVGLKKNETSVEKLSILDKTNPPGLPKKLSGVNDKNNKKMVEILKGDCSSVLKIALDSPLDNSSLILDSEQNMVSCNSSNIPAVKTGEDHSINSTSETTNKKHFNNTSAEETGTEHFINTSVVLKTSATVPIPTVGTSIKTQYGAEKKSLLAMLSKYEQLFQGRRFNLGSLKQQVRRQSSVAAKTEQECQKTLAAVERARKQLAALEAQYKVKAVQQTQSREMLVRLMTQQAADTATLGKLQHKTEHLGRKVKGAEYRIPGNGANPSPRGVSDLSPQAGIASSPLKRPSDSPALSPWAKRSNTWVNASYSVNNPASWQQSRAAAALHRDSAGHTLQNLTKFNPYSRSNNAFSVPKKIATPSTSQSDTQLFNSPSTDSLSVPAASENVAHMQKKTNVLSPQNELKSPAALNVSPISKISRLSESELRDRLLKKHKYSQLPKKDTNVLGAGQVSPITPKQSTLCPYDLLGTCHDDNCSLEHISCSTPSSVSSASSRSSKLSRSVPTNTCPPKATIPGTYQPDICPVGSKRSLTEQSKSTNKKQRVSVDVVGAGKVCGTSTVESGSACGESKDGESVRQVPVDQNGVSAVAAAAAKATDTSISQSVQTGEAEQADSESDDSTSDSGDSDSSSSDSDSDDSESELTSSDNDSPPRSPLKSSPESPVSRADSTEAPISCEMETQTTGKSVISSFSTETLSTPTPNADHAGTPKSTDGTRSCPPPGTTTIESFSVLQRKRVASVSDLTDDRYAMTFDLVKLTLRADSGKLTRASKSHDTLFGSSGFRNCSQEKDTRNTDSCTNANVRNIGAEQAGVASTASEKDEKQIVGVEKNELFSSTTENIVCCEQLKNRTYNNSNETSDHGDKPGCFTLKGEQRDSRCTDELDARSEPQKSCTAENMPELSALVDPDSIGECPDDRIVCVKPTEKWTAEILNKQKRSTAQPENSIPINSDDRIVCPEQPEICDAEHPDDRSVCTEQPDECAAECRSIELPRQSSLKYVTQPDDGAVENPVDEGNGVGQFEKHDVENPVDRCVGAEHPDGATLGSLDESSLACKEHGSGTEESQQCLASSDCSVEKKTLS